MTITTETPAWLPQPPIYDRLFARIDLAHMRGLEIGPLHNPQVRHHDGEIRYLDHATKEELRKKYLGNPDAEAKADDLVEVDYVIAPGQSIAEAIGDWGPVDYVMASHVIEHVPNPVGWLAQIEDVLVESGVVSLVIPDKRYCFDARRSTTTLAQFIDLYLRDPPVSTPAQIFDFESNFLDLITAQQLWDGADVTSMVRSDVPDPKAFALRRCREQLQSGEYVDVHASTFTPASFAELMGDLAELGLTNFAIAEIFPTDRNSYEFFATLEKLSEPDAQARSGRQAVAADAAREKVAAIEQAHWPPPPPPPPAPAGPAGTRLGPISPKEERLVELKRAAMAGLRKAASVLRRG